MLESSRAVVESEKQRTLQQLAYPAVGFGEKVEDRLRRFEQGDLPHPAQSFPVGTAANYDYGPHSGALAGVPATETGRLAHLEEQFRRSEMAQMHAYRNYSQYADHTTAHLEQVRMVHQDLAHAVEAVPMAMERIGALEATVDDMASQPRDKTHLYAVVAKAQAKPNRTYALPQLKSHFHESSLV